MNPLYGDRDTTLKIITTLARVDLDISLMKLYTYIPAFREFLSSKYAMMYLQRQLHINLGNEGIFPLLCVHLSIRCPSTSRVPYNICLRLAIRHNYPLELVQKKVDPSLILVDECCDRIVNTRDDNKDTFTHAFTRASTAIEILGEARTNAILYGTYTQYDKGIYQCIVEGGHDITQIPWHIEPRMCLLGGFTELASELFQISEDRPAVVLKYMKQIPDLIIPVCLPCIVRLDMLDFLKTCLAEHMFTVPDIVSKFDSHTSTDILLWLCDEHDYTYKNCKQQYCPYDGSILSVLKKLYSNTDEKVPFDIIHSVIRSDDIETLLWLKDRGDLDYLHKSFGASGITLEVLMSARQGPARCSAYDQLIGALSSGLAYTSA